MKEYKHIQTQCWLSCMYGTNAWKVKYQTSSLRTAWHGGHPGGWFNIKMSSYQYRKSHCGDKMVERSCYLHSGISYTGKMTSLYWIRTRLTPQLRVSGAATTNWTCSTQHNNYLEYAKSFILVLYLMGCIMNCYVEMIYYKFKMALFRLSWSIWYTKSTQQRMSITLNDMTATSQYFCFKYHPTIPE